VQAPSPPRRFSQRQQDLLALLLILLVAGLFRFWQLDRIPPGLFGDEAVNGLDALDALAGRARVFYPANFGREGLHMLLLAQAIHWIGPTAVALRVPSALAGVLTALATYWLGRELLARTWLRGTLTPLLAALFLSTSYWHVHFSRFGIRGVFTPLLAALAFAAFWHGANRAAEVVDAGHSTLRDGRCWAWFLVAGLFTGLGVHFYTASRLIPIFLGGFLLVQALYAWLLARRSRRTSDSTHPPLFTRALGPVLGLYAVAAMVFAPLGLYFLRTPGSLTQRASAVSLANPEISGGDPLGRLLQAATANLLQFFWPGAGDPARFYNLPGRPVFDLATALFVLAGLALCLWALRRGSSPHLFLLLWFPVMLAPTFLAVDRFPTLPRALGVIPGIYFFPALALGELALRSAAPRARRRWAMALTGGLITAVLVLHGGLAWRDYFQRWAPAAETFDAFEGDIAAAAAWVAANPDQQIFLSADIYRHPSWVYLHQHAPLSEIFTYTDPLASFFDGRSTLPLWPSGETTYLFTANAGPAPILAQIPGWAGYAEAQPAGAANWPGLTVYRLPANALDSDQFLPVDISFQSGPRLLGYRLQPAGNGPLELLLWWQVGAPQPGWYEGLQIQAGLQPAGGGPQLAQASSELAYRPTEWKPGSQALSWLNLPLPADLPADVRLAVRVVNQANGLPLAADGSDGDGWLSLPVP
jgi:4-amino-4-deoxy-L-arabinose transferase-like glycosyltransferase